MKKFFAKNSAKVENQGRDENIKGNYPITVSESGGKKIIKLLPYTYAADVRYSSCLSFFHCYVHVHVVG